MQTVIRAGIRISVCLGLGFVVLRLTASETDNFLNLAIYTVASLVCVFLLGAPFVSWAVEGVVGFFTGNSHDDWQPQYSIAEARVREGRYEEAIAQYREYTSQYPLEATPHLRIADLQLEHLKDPQSAVLELQAAAIKAKSADGFSLANCRLADVFISEFGDTASALRCYQAIQSRYPKTPQSKAALRRAKRLLKETR